MRLRASGLDHGRRRPTSRHPRPLRGRDWRRCDPGRHVAAHAKRSRRRQRIGTRRPRVEIVARQVQAPLQPRRWLAAGGRSPDPPLPLPLPPAAGSPAHGASGEAGRGGGRRQMPEPPPPPPPLHARPMCKRQSCGGAIPCPRQAPALRAGKGGMEGSGQKSASASCLQNTASARHPMRGSAATRAEAGGAGWEAGAHARLDMSGRARPE